MQDRGVKVLRCQERSVVVAGGWAQSSPELACGGACGGGLATSILRRAVAGEMWLGVNPVAHMLGKLARCGRLLRRVAVVLVVEAA